MAANIKSAKSYRALLSRLYTQTINDYEAMANERARLHREEWDAHADESIQFEIEIFANDIRDYMSRIVGTPGLEITGRHFVEDPEKAMQHLQDMRIFNTEHFADWFFSSETDYPRLKRYVQLLDYARLLVIEYIGLYQLTPTSKT